MEGSIKKAMVAIDAGEQGEMGRIGAATNREGKTEIHIADGVDMEQDDGFLSERTYPNSGAINPTKIDLVQSICARCIPLNKIVIVYETAEE